MDSSIWVAVISSTASIITCFLGFRFGQQDQSTLSSRKILQEQLVNFLAPLDLLLSRSNGKNWNDVRAEITSLITENYIYVPALILDKYNDLLSAEDFGAEKYVAFCIVVSLFYNWTKKRLGYPYNSRSIRKKFTPTYERDILIKRISEIFFPIALGVSIGAFIGMRPSEHFATASNSDVLLFVPCFIIVLGNFLFSLHRQK